MVGVLSSDCYIALDVMGNFILLDHSAAALHNQNSFFVIFIYFVVADHRKSLLLNFDPSLPVKSYHMVTADHRSIVLALDKHPIHLIAHDANIFLNFGLAYKFFVRSANNAIFLAFFQWSYEEDKSVRTQKASHCVFKLHIFLWIFRVLQGMVMRDLKKNLVLIKMLFDRTRIHG